MATKKKVKELQTFIPYDDDDSDDFEQDAESIMDEAMDDATHAQKSTFNFVDAMSGSDEKGVGKVKIIKVMTDGQDNEICGTFPMDKFQDYDSMIEYIRINYGGGEYRIHAKVPNDSGRLVLRANKLIRIAKEKYDSNDKNKSNSLNQDNAFSEVLNLMREQQKEMRSVIENVKPVKQTDLREMLETAAIFTTALAPIITAFIMNRPKPSSMNDLKAMLEITGQLSKSDDDGDEPANMMDMAMQFLSTFQKANAQQGNLIEHGEGATQGKPSGNTKYALYSVFLDALVQVSVGEPNVDDLVKQILKQFGEKEIIVIKQLIAQDKPLSFIIGYHPSLLNHADWLNDLIAAFEEILFTAVDKSDKSSGIDNELEATDGDTNED